MLKSSLLYKIINGIWDMCFIWKTEMRNVFRDEGVLIFCILVPLGYPAQEFKRVDRFKPERIHRNGW